MSIKLYLDVGNDECIILCGDPLMSGFLVTKEGRLRATDQMSLSQGSCNLLWAQVADKRKLMSLFN